MFMESSSIQGFQCLLYLSFLHHVDLVSSLLGCMLRFCFPIRAVGYPMTFFATGCTCVSWLRLRTAKLFTSDDAIVFGLVRCIPVLLFSEVA